MLFLTIFDNTQNNILQVATFNKFHFKSHLLIMKGREKWSKINKRISQSPEKSFFLLLTALSLQWILTKRFELSSTQKQKPKIISYTEQISGLLKLLRRQQQLITVSFNTKRAEKAEMRKMLTDHWRNECYVLPISFSSDGLRYYREIMMSSTDKRNVVLHTTEASAAALSKA